MGNATSEWFHSGLKGKLLEIISTNKNLTAKQIYYKLQRNYAITCTYQAMHKTLMQMLSDGMLVKQNTKYTINPAWVNNFKKNVDNLAEKVKSEKPEINLKELSAGESIHLNFNGILDLGWFLIDKLMIAPNPQKKACLALWRFCYSIIGLEEKHLNGLKADCKKNKWYVFVEEKNRIDKLFGDTLLAYGMKEVHYGVKCSTPLSDKMIIGDYVAEIIYPSWFRKLWAIQNKLPKTILEFNLAKHILYMRDPQPSIEVILTNDAKLAEKYRDEYLKK
jgi:hypothetical protein